MCRQDFVYQSPADNRGATGVLLVGHGTRDATGRSEFLETTKHVAQQVTSVVEPCFLELASPTMDDALRRLDDRGCRQVVACPLLLFAAGHAKQDIPHVLRKMAPGHVTIRQTRHLGCDSRLVELSALRYQETLAGRQSYSCRSALPGRQKRPGKAVLQSRNLETDEALAVQANRQESPTLVIMVGRGSHDAGATAEMHEFVRLRSAATPADRIECCFLAMASPRLESVLERVVETEFDRVVVQPHLLFHGELISRIKTLVEKVAQETKNIRWFVTGHLGPHPLLVDTIVDRINEVMEEAVFK